MPVTVEGSTGRSTNGQSKATAQISTGTSTTKGIANAQYTTDGKTHNVSVGVGIQQKAGKTTSVTIFGIKFSW